MRIDPVIAALRRDQAPQHRAQAALEKVRDGWRATARTGAVLAELEQYAAGVPLSENPVLDCLLGDSDEAREFVGALFAAFAQTLREHPLGHVPLRHQCGRGLAVLQLAAAGGAALSLIAYEGWPKRATAAATVCFAGGERHELCLAGTAEARFFEILSEGSRRAELACEVRRIAAGDALHVCGPRHARIIDCQRGCLVMLRLSRPDFAPLPAREFRISDGALVHSASGDRTESRDEMAAAVLGAMQRSDAAPVLAEIAQSCASEHLRWQALCQALALDTAVGFAILTTIARDQADMLAGPARSLRKSLIVQHPALAEMGMPCPA